MNDQTVLIFFGVIIVIMYAIMIRVAKSVFRKTGVNTVNGVHKVLWYAEMFTTFYAILSYSDNKYGLTIVIIIGSVLGFSALHLLLSLKAGMSNAIIMGILQGIAGPLTALLNSFIFTANIALKMNIKLFNMDMATESQISQNQAQKTFEAQVAQNTAQTERDARAEAVAKKAGFESADEAENAGFDTGKNYK